MNVATFVKRVSDFTGDARLYSLSSPLKAHDWGSEDDANEYSFVIVSTASFMGRLETYIFPADETGEVLSWSELPGSMKDTASHAEVLARTGYQMQS